MSHIPLLNADPPQNGGEPGPLFSAELVLEEQYVASMWTCSKLEADPIRAEARSSAEHLTARVPLRHDAAAILGHDDQLRRHARPAHHTVNNDRENREKLHEPWPSNERSGCNEQSM